MQWKSEVVEAMGKDGLLKSLRLRHVESGETHEIEASGLFFAIGHVPNSAFLAGQLKTDESGYIVTQPGTTETSVEGVFAAGDVQDWRWRQAITAAGTGCMAALQAENFLGEHGHH
jgi:thioredoxin reductase (NADPH)